MKARGQLIAGGLIFLSTSLFFLLVGCVEKKLDATTSNMNIDSLLVNFQNENLNQAVRLKYLESAIKQNSFTANDSLRMAYYNEIAYLATTQNDTTIFLNGARSGLTLAQRLKDNNARADAHWNYGIYYLKRKRYDSSYHHYRKAYNLFEGGNDYYAGKMLYHMGYIRSRIKDYTGCEILLYRAIALFEKEDKYKQLYLCYNLLGAVQDNLEEHEDALQNYEIALNYLKKTKNSSIYLMDTQNNIGLVYQNMGKQREAIQNFNEALTKKNLERVDPGLYARLLDNRAKSKLLGGKLENLHEEFYKALRIRDSIGNEDGVVISHLHLAQYYLYVGDSITADIHGTLAYNLANKMNLKRDALDAVLLLAKTNPDQQIFYLKKHINLTERLNQEERRIREKFTRIQFETDSYIDKNEKLERTWFWTIVGSLFLITILILIVVLLKQRSKTKELEFEVKQQQADEQIYLLTLEEIANLEKGKLEERRRISEELHDGILARMLGIRLNWERLKIEGTKEAIDEHKNCLHHLALVEREIRKISHDLQNEIWLQDTRFVRWIEQLVKERSISGNFEYKFYADASVDWEGFDDYFKANVYRMVEEALQNCIKHAEARLVSISLKKWGNFVEIEIRDNGKGFVKSNGNNGIGVKNMISRTKKLKGIFTINSVVGEGTVIQILIPNNDDL